MMIKNLIIITVVILLTLGLANQQLFAIGEFLVNDTYDYYQDNQTMSSIAMDADGDYVIAWQGYDLNDETQTDIYAKIYNSDGTPATTEFLVNDTDGYYQGEQFNPSAAMDADGNFVITWQGFGIGGDGSNIYARLYGSDGTPAGAEFLVNDSADYYQNPQYYPSAAMDNVGNFVITWQGLDSPGGAGWDIYARLYNSDGTPAGSEFLVNDTYDYYQNNQYEPFAAMDDDGDFAITWSGYNCPGGALYDIYARLYNSDGSPATGEFLVNDTYEYYQNNQNYSSIAMDSDGDIVITWQGWNSPGGSGSDIYARLFNSDGSPATGEFLVNDPYEYYKYHQRRNSVGMDVDGKFAITWYGNGPGGYGLDIYTRKFNSDGSPTSDPFLMNNTYEYFQKDQNYPSLAMAPDGNFVVSWSGWNSPGGSDWDIYAKKHIPGEENAIKLISFNAHAIESNINIEWKTGTEIDNIGFFIIKSEYVDSEFSLLNKNIIPAMGNAFSGFEYSYTDKNVNPAQAYFYWLVDVDFHSNYTVHGPVKVLSNLQAFELIK